MKQNLQNLGEEELKNKIAQNYFGEFDCTQIVGNVDFCVSPKAPQPPEGGVFDAFTPPLGGRGATPPLGAGGLLPLWGLGGLVFFGQKPKKAYQTFINLWCS